MTRDLLLIFEQTHSFGFRCHRCDRASSVEYDLLCPLTSIVLLSVHPIVDIAPVDQLIAGSFLSTVVDAISDQTFFVLPEREREATTRHDADVSPFSSIFGPMEKLPSFVKPARQPSTRM